MCCRVRGLLRWVFSLYYSKEPKVYTEMKIYNPTSAKIDWETVVPRAVVFTEKIQSVSIDDRKVRYKVWNEGDRVTPMSTEEQIRLFYLRAKYPWLWIGGNYLHSSQDRTALLEPYLLPGNKITLNLLNSLDSTITDWHYLDPATFKEVEFPSEGITIDAS